MSIISVFKSRFLFKLLAILSVILKLSCTTAKEKSAINDASNFKHFKIIVNYPQATSTDTLTLYIINPIFPNPEMSSFGQFVAVRIGSQFIFDVRCKNDNGYFSIMQPRTFSDKGGIFRKMAIVKRQFWESGDSIIINIFHKETAAGIYGKWEFKGNGSKKYRVRNMVYSVTGDGKNLPQHQYTKYFDNIRNHLIKEKQIQILERNKGKISLVAYEAMRADILYSRNSFRSLLYYYRDSIKASSDSSRSEFIRRYKMFSNKSERVKGEGISCNILAESPSYLSYLKLKFMTDAEIINGRYDQEWIYQRIKKTTTGLLREREVLLSILQSQRSANIRLIISDAKSYFQDLSCIRLLNSIGNKEKGTRIGDATFEDVNGLPVKISDFKGKVILFDVWFNGCGACMSVYKELTSKVSDYFKGNPDFILLSINTDRSRQRWINGIKLGLYTDKKAENVYTNGKGFKHPFIAENNIPFCPWLILVDRNGTIHSVDGKELFELESLKSSIENLLFYSME